jgi:limonene 1,2-monooxygenase
MEEVSADHGRTPNRGDWRLVGPMHVADTREQAREDVRYGIEAWFDYMSNVAALPLAPPGFKGADADSIIEMLTGMGAVAIGTPEDAISQIERLQKQSGGFGTYLLMSHEWADREATLHSYELIAREVMPHVQGSAASLQASSRWARERHDQFQGQMGAAITKAAEAHKAEREARKPR